MTACRGYNRVTWSAPAICKFQADNDNGGRSICESVMRTVGPGYWGAGLPVQSVWVQTLTVCSLPVGLREQDAEPLTEVIYMTNMLMINNIHT